MASRRVPLLHSVSVFQPPLTRYSRCSPETFRSSSSTPGSRSISLTGKERGERDQAGRKGRSFSFNSERENSEEKEKKKFLGVPAVSSISQQLNSFISASTQVAQTVMSDLLSNPHHPGVNPNIILDNFLMDLRQSLITSADPEIALPDVTASSVRLREGKLAGMANWTRWGDAKLETNGELAAGLTRTVIQMRLEQKINSQSELTELRVGSPGSLHIGLNGLGPLNWLGKKLVFRHVRDNIHTVLEQKAREMIESRLAQFSLVDQVSVMLLHL